VAFSRGLRIELMVDELGHEGGSAVMFASVLHRFFTRHASMNSYVETVLHSLGRGELMRWRPRLGARAGGLTMSEPRNLAERAAAPRRLAGRRARPNRNLYDFYQAMRRIARAHPQMPPLGEALRPVDEPVRVAQPGRARLRAGVACTASSAARVHRRA
jgi:hypothetical protein